MAFFFGSNELGQFLSLQQEVEKARAAGIENPDCPNDVDLHRPIVDGFVLLGDDGEPMHREPFVMDCWFDSGCASFAQWHHPRQPRDLREQLPYETTFVKVWTKLEVGFTPFSQYRLLFSIQSATNDV